MSTSKRFGVVLLEARESKGYSLERVGRGIDSSKSYVSGIENGRVAPPSPRMIRKLCRVLGLDYQEMLAKAWIEKRPRDLQLDVAMQAIRKAV
jgi:transcriptional regulator with XRE-family HTH domain